MIPSDIYHQRASECLQLAEGSSDIAERTRWRELALCWLRLSEYAEQFRAAERPLRMISPRPGAGTLQGAPLRVTPR